MNEKSITVTENKVHAEMNLSYAAALVKELTASITAARKKGEDTTMLVLNLDEDDEGGEIKPEEIIQAIAGGCDEPQQLADAWMHGDYEVCLGWDLDAQ